MCVCVCVCVVSVPLSCPSASWGVVCPRRQCHVSVGAGEAVRSQSAGAWGCNLTPNGPVGTASKLLTALHGGRLALDAANGGGGGGGALARDAAQLPRDSLDRTAKVRWQPQTANGHVCRCARALPGAATASQFNRGRTSPCCRRGEEGTGSDHGVPRRGVAEMGQTRRGVRRGRHFALAHHARQVRWRRGDSGQPPLPIRPRRLDCKAPGTLKRDNVPPGQWGTSSLGWLAAHPYLPREQLRVIPDDSLAAGRGGFTGSGVVRPVRCSFMCWRRCA